jgi:hypothetical protein
MTNENELAKKTWENCIGKVKAYLKKKLKEVFVRRR